MTSPFEVPPPNVVDLPSDNARELGLQAEHVADYAEQTQARDTEAATDQEFGEFGIARNPLRLGRAAFRTVLPDSAREAVVEGIGGALQQSPLEAAENVLGIFSGQNASFQHAIKGTSQGALDPLGKVLPAGFSSDTALMTGIGYYTRAAERVQNEAIARVPWGGSFADYRDMASNLRRQGYADGHALSIARELSSLPPLVWGAAEFIDPLIALDVATLGWTVLARRAAAGGIYAAVKTLTRRELLAVASQGLSEGYYGTQRLSRFFRDRKFRRQFERKFGTTPPAGAAPTPEEIEFLKEQAADMAAEEELAARRASMTPQENAELDALAEFDKAGRAAQDAVELPNAQRLFADDAIVRKQAREERALREQVEAEIAREQAEFEASSGQQPIELIDETLVDEAQLPSVGEDIPVEAVPAPVEASRKPKDAPKPKKVTTEPTPEVVEEPLIPDPKLSLEDEMIEVVMEIILPDHLKAFQNLLDSLTRRLDAADKAFDAASGTATPKKLTTLKGEVDELNEAIEQTLLTEDGREWMEFVTNKDGYAERAARAKIDPLFEYYWRSVRHINAEARISDLKWQRATKLMEAAVEEYRFTHPDWQPGAAQSGYTTENYKKFHWQSLAVDTTSEEMLLATDALKELDEGPWAQMVISPDPASINWAEVPEFTPSIQAYLDRLDEKATKHAGRTVKQRRAEFAGVEALKAHAEEARFSRQALYEAMGEGNARYDILVQQHDEQVAAGAQYAEQLAAGVDELGQPLTPAGVAALEHRIAATNNFVEQTAQYIEAQSAGLKAHLDNFSEVEETVDQLMDDAFSRQTLQNPHLRRPPTPKALPTLGQIAHWENQAADFDAATLEVTSLDEQLAALKTVEGPRGRMAAPRENYTEVDRLAKLRIAADTKRSRNSGATANLTAKVRAAAKAYRLDEPITEAKLNLAQAYIDSPELVESLTIRLNDLRGERDRLMSQADPPKAETYRPWTARDEKNLQDYYRKIEDAELSLQDSTTARRGLENAMWRKSIAEIQVATEASVLNNDYAGVLRRQSDETVREYGQTVTQNNLHAAGKTWADLSELQVQTLQQEVKELEATRELVAHDPIESKTRASQIRVKQAQLDNLKKKKRELLGHSVNQVISAASVRDQAKFFVQRTADAMNRIHPWYGINPHSAYLSKLDTQIDEALLEFYSALEDAENLTPYKQYENLVRLVAEKGRTVSEANMSKHVADNVNADSFRVQMNARLDRNELTPEDITTFNADSLRALRKEMALAVRNDPDIGGTVADIDAAITAQHKLYGELVRAKDTQAIVATQNLLQQLQWRKFEIELQLDIPESSLGTVDPRELRDADYADIRKRAREHFTNALIKPDDQTVGKRLNPFQRVKQIFTQATTDKYTRLNTLANQQYEKLGANIPEGELLAQLVAGNSGISAAMNVRYRRIMKGVRETLTPTSIKQGDLDEWLTAKHASEVYNAAGNPDRAVGYYQNAGEVIEHLAGLRKSYDEWEIIRMEEAAAQLRAPYSGFLDILAADGAIQPQFVEMLHALYPEYVPTNIIRAIAGDAAEPQVKAIDNIEAHWARTDISKLTTAQKLASVDISELKEFTNVSDVLPPTIALARNLEAMERQVHRHRILRLVADNVGLTGPAQPKLSLVDGKTSNFLWRSGGVQHQGVIEKGLHDEIENLLDAHPDLNLLFKVGDVMNSLPKQLMTSSNPKFWFVTLPYDIITTWFQHGAGPVTFAKALKASVDFNVREILDGYVGDLVEAGGLTFGYGNADRLEAGIRATQGEPDFLDKTMRSLGMRSDRAGIERQITKQGGYNLRDDPRTTIPILRQIQTLWKIMGQVSQTFELTPRVAAAMKQLDKGASLELQALTMRRDTVDFGLSGEVTGALNHIVFFLNPAIQGFVKPFRAMGLFGARDITVNSTVARWRMAGLVSAVMSIYLYNRLDPAYNDVHQDVRFGSLLLMNPFAETEYDKYGRAKPNYITVLPTTRELAVPIAMTTWLMEHIDRKLLHDYPHEDFGKMIQTMIAQASPVNQITHSGGGLTPQPLNVYNEQIRNFDGFRGKPIVPDDLINLPLRDQVLPHTSAAATYVGPRIGVSPLRLDHVVSGLGGGLGQEVMRLNSFVVNSLRYNNILKTDRPTIELAKELAEIRVENGVLPEQVSALRSQFLLPYPIDQRRAIEREEQIIVTGGASDNIPFVSGIVGRYSSQRGGAFKTVAAQEAHEELSLTTADGLSIDQTKDVAATIANLTLANAEKQNKLDQLFYDGHLSGPAWRDRTAEFNTGVRAILTQMEITHPNAIQVQTNPLLFSQWKAAIVEKMGTLAPNERRDLNLAFWYSFQPTNEADGYIDYRNLHLRELWWQDLPEQDKAELTLAIQANMTGAKQHYWNAQRDMAYYWAAPDRLTIDNPALQDRYLQYLQRGRRQQSVERQNDRELDRLLDDITKERRQVRRDRPEIDAALVLYYDMTPINEQKFGTAWGWNTGRGKVSAGTSIGYTAPTSTRSRQRNRRRR